MEVNNKIQVETSESRGYVVSIVLNSSDGSATLEDSGADNNTGIILKCGDSGATQEDPGADTNVGRLSGSCISISVGGDSNMVRPSHFYFYPPSPSDSGNGSDFDPPSVTKRKQQASPVDSGVSSVTTNRSSDTEEEDSISCDSLNSSELNGDSILQPPSPPELIDTILPGPNNFILPGPKILSGPAANLEQQIKTLEIQEEISTPPPPPPVVVSERTYEERSVPVPALLVPPEHHYDFHLHENADEGRDEVITDTFAGVRDVLGERGAIKSARGTVRGVKNRVRAGIATFLQLDDSKSFKEREQGKLVVYTTTMGVVRATYLRCVKVKQILRTLLVKFEERDVFMSRDTQQEIRARMKNDAVVVPQVFLEGHHLGDADTIERLNESGELRRLLRPFKCPGASIPCCTCGGYRLLPCTSCSGSKKSVHRNHFTAEFVALKCMTCDESGLVRCHACS